MKKNIILILICLLLIGCSCQKRFSLDKEYYGKADIIKIEGSELLELEASNKSFLVFVNMTFCTAADEFCQVLDQFLEKHQLTIYETAFTQIKTTKLGEHVKYYPTIAIYKKGKVVRALDPNQERDLKCYETVAGLEECLGQYLILTD